MGHSVHKKLLKFPDPYQDDLPEFFEAFANIFYECTTHCVYKNCDKTIEDQES